MPSIMSLFLGAVYPPLSLFLLLRGEMRIADNGLSAHLLTVTMFKLKIISPAGIRSVSTWRWQSSSSMALQNGENKEKTSHHSMLEP